MGWKERTDSQRCSVTYAGHIHMLDPPQSSRLPQPPQSENFDWKYYFPTIYGILAIYRCVLRTWVVKRDLFSLLYSYGEPRKATISSFDDAQLLQSSGARWGPRSGPRRGQKGQKRNPKSGASFCLITSSGLTLLIPVRPDSSQAS